MDEDELSVWKSCVETAIQRHAIGLRGRPQDIPGMLGLMESYGHPKSHVNSVVRLVFAMDNNAVCIQHLARYMNTNMMPEYRSSVYAAIFRRLAQPEAKVRPEEVDRLLRLFGRLDGSCAAVVEPRRMVLGNAAYLKSVLDKAELDNGGVLTKILNSFLVTHPAAVALRAAPAAEHAARC